MLSLELLQAAGTTETVVLQALIARHHASCLRAASAAVLDASGDLGSVVPPAAAGEFKHDYSFSIPAGTGASCCACAPICGCGTCD